VMLIGYGRRGGHAPNIFFVNKAGAQPSPT